MTELIALLGSGASALAGLIADAVHSAKASHEEFMANYDAVVAQLQAAGDEYRKKFAARDAATDAELDALENAPPLPTGRIGKLPDEAPR